MKTLTEEVVAGRAAFIKSPELLTSLSASLTGPIAAICREAEAAIAELGLGTADLLTGLTRPTLAGPLLDTACLLC